MCGLNRKIRNALAALTFLSVLAAIGCGNYSPIAPSQDPLSLQDAANPQFAQLLPTAKSSDKPNLSSIAEQEISAEIGGMISNGYFSLYFPPGALDEDTVISLDMPHYPNAVVRLGPHGITFNKDVVLSVSADVLDSDVNNLNFLWYNEDTGLWELIYNNKEGIYIKAGLSHFSEYGLADKG